MDPITAISLVSGILTFVGAAEKILKLSWSLYNTVEGSSEETKLRLDLANSMNSISNHIISSSRRPLSGEDRAIFTLAQECDRLTNDIQNLLQSLRPRRYNSMVQSSLAAVRTAMREPRVRNLEDQIRRCRDQLQFHIAVLSR
jgi:hypothetical protein